VRGDGGGKAAMIGRANAIHGDQRAGAGRGDGSGAVRSAPQQWQRRSDQAGAQHAEQCEHGFHRVRHLHSNDGVAREPVGAQSRGDRGNGPIGLGIGEAARHARSEVLAIGCIDQGDIVGPPRNGGTEQVVKGNARAVAGDPSRLGGSEGHDTSHGDFSRHQVSGR